MTSGSTGKKPAAPSVRRYPKYLCCASCGAQCDEIDNGPCAGQVLYVPDYGKCRRHLCAAHDILEYERGGAVVVPIVVRS
jgi:hypothetical protein